MALPVGLSSICYKSTILDSVVTKGRFAGNDSLIPSLWTCRDDYNVYNKGRSGDLADGESMNDRKGIQAKYGDKIMLHWGWDSFGLHNHNGSTEEQVRKEERRCINRYGKDEHYPLFPVECVDVGEWMSPLKMKISIP